MLEIQTLKGIVDSYFGDVDTPKNDVTLKQYVTLESLKETLEFCKNVKHLGNSEINKGALIVIEFIEKEFY